MQALHVLLEVGHQRSHLSHLTCLGNNDKTGVLQDMLTEETMIEFPLCMRHAHVYQACSVQRTHTCTYNQTPASVHITRHPHPHPSPLPQGVPKGRVQEAQEDVCAHAAACCGAAGQL